MKKVYDHSKKSIDYLKFIVVNTSLKPTDQEKQTISTSFRYSSQDQSTENNSKMILTHILRRCNGNKSSSHPSTNIMTPSEHVALKILSIEIK